MDKQFEVGDLVSKAAARRRHQPPESLGVVLEILENNGKYSNRIRVFWFKDDSVEHGLRHTTPSVRTINSRFLRLINRAS